MNALRLYLDKTLIRGAISVTLRPGEVNEHVDLVVVRAKSMCVSTTLVTPAAGSGEEWIGVMLAEPYPMSQSKVAVGRFRQPGLIEVCGVTPGLYLLMALSTPSEKTVLGFQSISVSGSRALALPATHLDALQPVSGKVSIASEETQETQAAKKEVPASLWINLEPKDRIMFMGESLHVNVPPNGQFAIPAVAPDAYWVNVGGLPAGYFVKSVRSGQ